MSDVGDETDQPGNPIVEPQMTATKGWTCPICGRWEDGTGPCAHTAPPKQNADLAWLAEDIKRAGQQMARHRSGR